MIITHTLDFKIDTDDGELKFQIEVSENEEMEWELLKPERYSAAEQIDISDFLTSNQGTAAIRTKLDKIKDDALSEIAHDKFLENQS